MTEWAEQRMSLHWPLKATDPIQEGSTSMSPLSPNLHLVKQLIL